MHLNKFPRLALLASLFLLVSLGFAEDKPAPEAPHPVRAEPPLLSINFPGGPLSKLVVDLSKGEKLSIIQSAGLDPVLPAFSVSNVRVDAVIGALGQIVEAQGFHLQPIGPNLAVLSKIDPGVRGSQGFASFQLESKISARAGRTPEEVIAAIQMGCEFATPGQPSSTLRFKYHPGTKLLFVAGTQEEIAVAHQVFGSLPDGSGKDLPPTNDKK